MLSEEHLARHAGELETDGFTVMEGVIPPSLVAELKDTLDRVEAEHGIGYRDTSFEGKQTIRIYNLLRYHEAFWQVPIFPDTLAVAERALDLGLQLSSLSAITLGPGQEAQPIHADTQMIPLPRPHVPIAINCIWALTDFTRDNGATRIVPGSHKWDQNPPYDRPYEDYEVAEMPAGSAILFNSQTWHGGGENVSDGRRYAIANYYCAGWIRQQENQQLGVPWEMLQRMPRRLQELCGFGIYKGMYGHIENQDPIEMLGRERGGMMVWEASEKRARGRAAAAGD